MSEALEANATLVEIAVGNKRVGSTVKLKASGELKVITLIGNDGSVKFGDWASERVSPSEFDPVPAVLPLQELRDAKIEKLDLKNRGLGTDGARMLAAVLKSNSSVTEVSV